MPERAALSPRLLADLVRRPLFLAAIGVNVAGCLAAARWRPRALHPLWPALGCGAAFGVNALLLKIVPTALPAGLADPLRQWPLYLMVFVTPVGFLLNQNAFQAGTMIAPVLAVITTADPLVSMAAGAVFLHEKIATAPLDLAAEGLALAVMIGGITVLAQRAPQAAQARGGNAGQSGVLIAFCDRLARADNATARPGCSTGSFSTERRRISPAA